MSGIEYGLLAFAFLLVLLALRVHIAVAMLITGITGYVSLVGWTPLLAYLKNAAFARYSVYDLAVVPLFLLMGQFALRGGLSKGLFDAANAFVGHWRGGIAMGAVGACAGFGAICGSSLATAATMGQVALPELRRHGYAPGLATGALSAGGTLGVLIPPSVVLVIYAILTEQNIARLFLAALVPGILAAIGYMLTIMVFVRINPTAGPAGPRIPWSGRLQALLRIWHVLAIFVIVIGGIYAGIFTPTEAAAVGAVATGIVALLAGGLRGGGWLACIYGTAQATGMIFLVLLGADVLNVFLALTQLPGELAAWVGGSGLPPLAVLFSIFAMLVVLGCIMDSLSMILLMVPIFFPVVMGLELFGLGDTEKAIWFGIMMLMLVEIGLITPPVGMNVYIINSLAGDVPMSTTFRGVVPFLISDGIRILLLVFVPPISLFLVRMFG
ncbi:TRAP transporter large permease [Thauera sp.]|jgi:C4-dicarboxylate transporter DctM subunit|uniref:TRAP transporter large permease n=1 Tax=Thauera sp. TaxID=1905334 RepID=UPI001A3C5556|nr:TRAP transporter large permease [Thauera sp.]MBL8465694.1 TRAP transporter large permease [Thauera sp.]HRO34965.1 TRAP transporter large permease [Thauera sp.]